MGQEENKPKILIVDDVPENIYILMGILKDRYTVMAANNGARALKIVEMDPSIGLILLDIMMPDMDGYTVCNTLKADPTLKAIPVIFISAMSDLLDIVKGFEMGAVDYITKPFHPQEVLVRVNTHLELQNAKSDLQTLLSKTLTGSIKVLVEILSFVSPPLVEKSNRIRRFAREMFQVLPINSQEVWIIDLAIMLSHIGCLSMTDILKKKSTNAGMTKDEQTRYEQHPIIGADIVAKIPRMEDVAEIISRQLIYPVRYPSNLPDVVYYGSSLLNLLLSYDDLITFGHTPKLAVSKLIDPVYGYPIVITDRLYRLINQDVYLRRHIVKSDKLVAGMVLNEDIVTKTGATLLTKGTELTDNLIQMIQRFANSGNGIHENISIMETEG